MNINEIIGAKIKATRLERKLSREQVARRCGVAQQTIEKYEKGSIEISVKKLIQISNILNVGISYLLLDENDKNNTAFNYYINKQIELNKKN